MNLDVVKCRVFLTVSPSLDLHRITWTQLHSFDPSSRGRTASWGTRRQMVVRHPLINDASCHQELELRCPRVLVKVLNVDVVPAGVAFEGERCRTTFRRGPALHGFTARRGLRWRHADGSIALQTHRLGLDPIRIVPYPAQRIGN